MSSDFQDAFDVGVAWELAVRFCSSLAFVRARLFELRFSSFVLGLTVSFSTVPLWETTFPYGFSRFFPASSRFLSVSSRRREPTFLVTFDTISWRATGEWKTKSATRLLESVFRVDAQGRFTLIESFVGLSVRATPSKVFAVFESRFYVVSREAYTLARSLIVVRETNAR